MVVSIIGILISLLLPAVQSARESGRRVQCANNLKQIGLAFMAHLEATGAFPNGGDGYETVRTWINGIPAAYDRQTWSWGYQILPYTDQEALWSITSDQTVASTPVPLYFCPTRRRPVALSGGPWQSQPSPRAMGDYAGNAGVATLGDDGGGTYGDGLIDGVVVRGGVVLQQSAAVSNATAMPISQAQISDGCSSTFLVGEKRMNISFCMTACGPDDNDGYVGGFQDDVVRWGAFPPAPDWQGPFATFATLIPGDYQFGSSHPGVVNFVFCDGSLQGIHYSIDPTVFSHASSRNDGVPFSPDAL